MFGLRSSHVIERPRGWTARENKVQMMSVRESKTKNNGKGSIVGLRDQPAAGAKSPRRGCSLCGRASDKLICDACADKIRAEALGKKKREEKGA